jgi:SAM-dependent methyltransferase
MKLKYNNRIKNDIIEWDVNNWFNSIIFWEKYSSLDLKNCTALELGSNNGGLSLWLALNGCKVICSDVVIPTNQATQIHKKYGVDNKIKYEIIDATNIPYQGCFDIIVFKSILGGIGRNNNIDKQINTINQIYKALKTGGKLFFAENILSSPIHQYLRKKYVNWGENWRYISVEEMKEFLKPFSGFDYITNGFLGAMGRNEFQRKFLGQIDKMIFNLIIPESWKYIMIGIAKK